MNVNECIGSTDTYTISLIIRTTNHRQQKNNIISLSSDVVHLIWPITGKTLMLT